jgi:hypothetical protein
MHLDLSGYPDTYFRRGLTRARRPEQRGLVEGWVARLGDRVSLKNLSHSGPVDYTRNVALDAQVSVEGHLLGEGAVRMFRLPLLQHPFGGIFAPDLLEKAKEDEDRKSGMRMRATRLLSYSDTLTLPAGWVAEELPAEKSIDNDAAKLEFSIEEKDGALHYTCEVALKKQIIPPDQYAAYREVNEALHELAESWVVCRTGGPVEASPVAEAGGTPKEVTR